MSNLASKYKSISPSTKYKSISPSTITDLDTTIYSIASADRTHPTISSRLPAASKTLSLSGNEFSNACKSKSQTLLKSIISCSNKEFLSLSTSKSQSSITSKPGDVFKTKYSPICKDESVSDSTTNFSSFTKHPTLLKSKSVFCSNKEFLSLPPFKMQSSITSEPHELCKTKSPFSKYESFSDTTTKSLSSMKQPTLLKSKSVISCSNKKFYSLSPSKSQSSITSKYEDVYKTKSSPFSKDESFSDSTAKSSSSTKKPTQLKSNSVFFSNKDVFSLPPFKMQSINTSKPQEVCKTKSAPFSNNISFIDSTTKSYFTKQPNLLKSKSAISCPNKELSSLSPSKSQSTVTSKSQEVFKTKYSSFSKDESFSDSTTKSSPSTKETSTNVFTCKSQTKPPSPNVSTCKSQITSNTDSPYRREFSKLNIAKQQTRPKTKLSLISESPNMPITKSQAAPKMKSSSLMIESSGQLPSHVSNQNSSTVSNNRSKRRRRHALKKIQQETTLVKTDATKLKVQKNAKTMETKCKELNSKIERSKMENSSYKKVKNVERMLFSIRFVVRDLQSSPDVTLAPHNIKKDVSTTEKLTDVDSMVNTSIKTKYEFKKISVNQNTDTAIVSILNINSNCIPGKRIIYDEKKEEQRKRTMSIIRAKQTLLKDKIVQGKLLRNKTAKNIFIMQAKAIQSEIDAHFQNLDELGKMPNHSKQKQNKIKPKVKKAECINNLQTLLQHLADKILNEVNIENIHQFINFEIVEEAFDEFQIIKKQHLKKIEVAKHKMNLDLQNLFNFLKLNRESFTSNALFPRINASDDILSHCGSLKNDLQNNLRHLFRLRLLTSNFMKSVQNYRMSEKMLFDEWNSFIFNDHRNFFTIRKIR